MKTLFIIAVRDEELSADNPFFYAVAEEEQGAAEEVALQIHVSNTREPEETHLKKPLVDHELSFDVTCASDKQGRMYNIQLVSS